MANVKLGNSIFRGVKKVKLNTEDGGTVEFSKGELGLNISFGDTPPADTSALWVKASRPDNLKVRRSNENPIRNDAVLDSGVSLPNPTSRIAAAAVGKKIYLFGGYDGGAYSDAINVYDTETNTIETLGVTLPTAAGNICAAAIGTKIYLFGGRTASASLNTINAFDTETNSVATLDVTLPSATYALAGCVAGTNVFLIGGSSSTTAILNFDSVNESISTESRKMPRSISLNAAAVVNGSIFTFSGYSSSETDYAEDVDQLSLYVHAFGSDISFVYGGVASGGNVVRRGYSPTAVSANGKIYVFGGQLASSYYSGITEFNPETYNSKALRDYLPYGAYYIAAASVENKIYLFGGEGESLYDTITIFDPEAISNTVSDTMKRVSMYEIPACVDNYIYGFFGSNGYVNKLDVNSGMLEYLPIYLPYHQDHHGVAAVGKSIYLFGGRRTQNYSPSYTDEILVFNTEDNTLTQLDAKLPMPLQYSRTVVVGTKIYLFSGFDASGNTVDSICVFDIAQQTVETLDITLDFENWRYGVLYPVGSKIYIMDRARSKAVEVFDTETNTITTLDMTLPYNNLRGIVTIDDIMYAVCGAQIIHVTDRETLSGVALYDTGCSVDPASVFVINDTLYTSDGVVDKYKLWNFVFEHELLLKIAPNERVQSVFLGSENGLATKVPAAIYKDGDWVEI